MWLRGIDEAAVGAVEWWRVVAVKGTCGSQLLFIDQGRAESFARLLLADCCESVLVEHWRDGEQVDADLMGRVTLN